MEAKPLSSAAFIEKASWYQKPYISISKKGTLDIHPQCARFLTLREDDQVSHQAEMAIAAAQKA